MDEGCMMKSDTLKTAESRPKSERRRACLDQTYESPSFVDQVQLDDLHIKCYDVEEQFLKQSKIIQAAREKGPPFFFI